MEYEFETHGGEYDLQAYVRSAGSDFLVAIWGGEMPHIGAVAIAQSRTSLKASERTSSTASVISILGHREGDIAKEVAEKLASGLNATVVVTAGMHWSNITRNGILKVEKNSRILVDMILNGIETTVDSEEAKHGKKNVSK